MQPPFTIVEQTGIVGLFEICFEQSWKLMKAVLEDNGRFEERIGSPKAIIKTAYQCGLINDCEAWIDLINSRNILAHTYSDEKALSVIENIKTKYLDLFIDLKKEIDERWL